MKRRTFVAGGVAATAAGLLPRVSTAQEKESVTLQIDGAAVPFYAPIYVAQEKGLFAKHGLELRISMPPLPIFSATSRRETCSSGSPTVMR